MTRVSIKTKPTGDALAEIQRNLKSARVAVGFPKGTGDYPNGVPVLEVAVANEFGTVRIPERSFMRSALADGQDKYKKMGAALTRKVIAGSIDTEDAIAIIGEEAVGDIQDMITELDAPPNSPETIARKGSANPLIDTGFMRQSVRSEVVS